MKDYTRLQDSRKESSGSHTSLVNRLENKIQLLHKIKDVSVPVCLAGGFILGALAGGTIAYYTGISAYESLFLLGGSLVLGTAVGANGCHNLRDCLEEDISRLERHKYNYTERV